ncbi:MAG: Aerobic respiration control sensor protein ArcB [Lentisphaerae bacterium ADurb.Bin242]|nr:MAG: Aerobic respiration control sensor protein ArcB [Lentisphaerae bacterium ADurb.Bin242]
MKKNTFLINMTVLYILVGVVFFLITGMNIYAYRIIVGMGESYANLAGTSKDFRTEFNTAFAILKEIVEDGKNKKLEQDVWPHLDKAQKNAEQIRKIQTNLNLEPEIDKFRNLASDTYAQSDPKKRKQSLNDCNRLVQNAIDKIDALETEHSALIRNEMSLVGFVYAVLLIGNFVAFASIFFVIYMNDRNFKTKAERLHADNANFHAIMQGLDSILITIDNSGFIRSWNSNATRYFELQEEDVFGKNMYELIPVFTQFKDFFDTVFYSLKRHYKYHERMHVNKGPMRIVDILCVPLISSSYQKDYAELLIKMDDVTSFSTEEDHGVRERSTQLVSTAMDNVVRDSANLNAHVGQTIEALNAMATDHGLSEEMIPFTAYLNNALAQISMVPQKYASTLQKGELNKIQIDLNEMVMYVLRICLRTFDSSINIEVSLNELKSWILADPIALSRTFFCLLNNAAEAVTEMRPEGTPRGGIISVSVEKIAGEKIVCDKIMRFRHAIKEPAYWVILISDTGVGIPLEIQKNIYDPFFTTKDNTVHKGLGLSVAINVINDLGGFIDVNSTPGRGSVFKIYVPELAGVDNTATSANASLDADDSEIVPGHGVILFVNDDIFMRKITKKLLEKLGYTVVDTDNGFEALDIYAQNMSNIKCVLVNINSGHFRNIDICTHLKEMDPDAKAVVMVNSEFDDDAARLHEAGFTDFVKKPYSVPQLSQMLRKYTAEEEQQA